MIVSREYIKFKERLLIEKLLIKPPFRLEARFPNEACYIYLRQGQLLINSSSEKVPVCLGESIMLNCGTYFVDFIDSLENATTEVYAIHLHPELLKEIYRKEIPRFLLDAKTNGVATKVSELAIMDRFIESLIFYFENPSIVNDEILVLKLKELILLLLQTVNAPTVVALLSGVFSRTSISIAETVNTHLYSDFSIAQLAKLTGLSLSSFKREFRIVFNDTPANYIKNKKLERGAELLKLSKASISEIAYEVGFNGLSHFSNSFQSLYRISPSEYRNRSGH